jgi:uncharacterized membrane protein
MLGRSKTTPLKDSAATLKELTQRLAQTPALASRFSDDRRLHRQVERAQSSVRKALKRVERKQDHRLRNTLIALGIAGAVTAAAAVPLWLRRRGRTKTQRIDAWVEVGVPVSTAYNQWTQFEDFPLFMEGVDHVQQLDATRLHWAATIAGKQAEWDAKIIEQHPDRLISWISEDGKQTTGIVTFKKRAEDRTLITLSMGYQPEGLAEAAGSAAGLDERRVRGDLERFKELIETRSAETGAWRGEISAGTTQ